MLVCTDSAARGIDIPGVTHVVQADFAATAIDFLHRVLTQALKFTSRIPVTVALFYLPTPT